jgi:hypothetical protein
VATTTTRGYPFPEDSDPADVPYDVEQLAAAINAAPGIAALTQAQIDALSAALKWGGRIVWNSTDGAHQFSNGSTFADLVVALSSATPAATSTAGSAGSNDDAARGDHVHALGTHNHTSSTTGGVIPVSLITDATTARTLALTDAAQMIQMTSTSTNTVTVPQNSEVAFPTGSTLTILRAGSGLTSLVAGTNVTLNGTPGLKLRAQWSAATLIKRDTNVWVAFGDLAP